jgi:hypothetical protein
MGESGCIDQRFIDSALVGDEWSASHPGRLYPRRKNPRYPLDRRLDGTQSRSRRRGEEKILDPTVIMMFKLCFSIYT